MNIKDNTQDNTWCVYRHISPSGKVYIGITHHKDPKRRWGKNGSHYTKGQAIYNAILKYGWNNIKHEVLFSNCSEHIAKYLEKVLILHYKSLGISYNITIGGDGHNLGKNSDSAEYRTALSRIYRATHQDYDAIQYQKYKEKKKQLAREYYWKHRDKVLLNKKCEVNKEKARKRAAEWRAKHPNYMKEYMKNYNKKSRKNGKDSNFS